MIRCLAIESSCDETAIAIVDSDRNILSNNIYSQIAAHAPHQGVVPEIASRYHLDIIDKLTQQTLSDAQLTLDDIDIIAVTRGPGLIGGLLVGVVFAKALAFATNKPLLGINHLEGHALTVRLTSNTAYPYLLLLVSGGHSQIILVTGLGEYQILGTTRDDAVGEAFDKLAKMLNLPYPGGPEIEKLALKGNVHAYDLPKPLIHSGDADFSLSGLKTALSRTITTNNINASSSAGCDLAASFQYTVATLLTTKLKVALAKARATVPTLNQLVVAGGVAANQYLRQQLQEFANSEGMQAIYPPLKLCTDNAAMIAWCAIERYQKLQQQDSYEMEPRNRWPL